MPSSIAIGKSASRKQSALYSQLTFTCQCARRQWASDWSPWRSWLRGSAINKPEAAGLAVGAGLVEDHGIEAVPADEAELPVEMQRRTVGFGHSESDGDEAGPDQARRALL